MVPKWAALSLKAIINRQPMDGFDSEGTIFVEVVRGAQKIINLT